jgi:hypothetical protein
MDYEEEMMSWRIEINTSARPNNAMQPIANQNASHARLGRIGVVLAAPDGRH